MIINIFAKTDIPFSLLGIRRGPLSESDCSSLTEVQLYISDLPFVQNKDYQYSVSHLGIGPDKDRLCT